MVKFFCKLLGVKSKRDFFLLLSLWKNPIFVVKMLRRSQSQNSQDVFVAHQLKLWDSPRESYYFVEFGAADGIYLSNTFLLESAFNWKGLLVEPGRVWRESLLANRTCAKDFRCVYSESGRSITFSETEEPGLSTISAFTDSDRHGGSRKKAINYPVKTVTLFDLLSEYKCPKVIDYLSIDTEGSEYEILKNFPFHKFQFRIITVEHNFTQSRGKIHDLLVGNGYRQVLKRVSYMDDWYLLSKNYF